MKRSHLLFLFGLLLGTGGYAADNPKPFGDGPRGELDLLATGEWREAKETKRFEGAKAFLNVPRDEVIGFALYTHQDGVLKLTTQLFPLLPEESREITLAFKRDGEWQTAATAPVIYPGWSAHFRVEDWDNAQDVPYRVSHAGGSSFDGLIRKDPRDKETIVVASLSCNSKNDRGDRDNIVRNLKLQDPDLLFFAGDQSYDHREHTYAWLMFGRQFAEVIKDRPTITIVDDHDIGQANIWGEGGKVATNEKGPSGGYYWSPDYVKMVERCQTTHLPDPFDPTPILQGISVYYTSLEVGGIDFAILEDRKFKSGPEGKIPQMGPRPDHIVERIDPALVDVPGLKLLGDRQLRFLREWGQDWTDAEMKAVLSQTSFCSAVHLHGKLENRLIADLDSNAWPQTGRNKALVEIRRAMACHIAGDQHLSTVVKHGIDAWGDGPYSFVSPAIVNTIYGRWWWPESEKAGNNAVPGSPLPWTGEYKDGLGNLVTMFAYANPDGDTLRAPENKKSIADGYSIIRFNKTTHETIFECWPRFCDVSQGDSQQFKGWPVSFHAEENDGRKPAGYLAPLSFPAKSPVVQVVEETSGDILYTRRIIGKTCELPVYAEGTYTVKYGSGIPNAIALKGAESAPKGTQNTVEVGAN